MRKSRLSQYKQARLLELFIAGSTARIAAELVGVHRNTAAYCSHRLRVLIAEHVDKHTWFDGEIELDESYFGGVVKVSAVEGQLEKCLFSGFSSVVARFIPRSYPMLNRGHYCQ